MDPIYKIDGKDFKHKPIGKILWSDLEYMDACFNARSVDDQIKLDVKPTTIFPLILIPVDDTTDTTNVNWNKICPDDTFDIVVEYMARKTDFFLNTPGYVKSLVEEKLKSRANGKAGLENQDSSGQK